MIEQDFRIDFQNRWISYASDGSGETHTINEFYSFLQTHFAKPQNMNHEIPIEAGSNKKYALTNGWGIDEEALKHLERGSLILEVRDLDGKKFKEL